MAAAIAHRGPDEHGIWLDACVGLAARRLRVVDLVTGQQPLANEDGSVRLVANGEIYNAGELRDDLRRKGHLFTTRTATEVILHAYEDEGPACLERLEGMFAFALWDGRRQRLVLARDRFGEKPLYYARLSRTLLFASEPKALLMHPRVSRELDWTALARYLTYEYVPAPHAIFRAVRKLPPAHWMAVGVDGAETGGRDWEPPPPGALRRRPPASRRAPRPPGARTRHRRPLGRRRRRAVLRLPHADRPWRGRSVRACSSRAPSRGRRRRRAPADLPSLPELRFRAAPLPARGATARPRATPALDGELRARDAEQPARPAGPARDPGPGAVHRGVRWHRAAPTTIRPGDRDRARLDLLPLRGQPRAG